jgi:amidase
MMLMMSMLSFEEEPPTLLSSIRLGERSVVEVTVAHLEMLRRVHTETNAIVAFEDARALADASELDRAFVRNGTVGPLHGLPITVKDWIDVEGFPCAGGSVEFRDRRPDIDATVASRLRGAGAVIVAKTRVWGRDSEDGRVKHPLDVARSVGGSSSGEAVVVATGASPLGIGSDSGGSIRLPAAWCGVFGLKPTKGRVPTTGHFPQVGALSDGRTQIGPLARSVDVLELALSVMSGPDWHDAGVSPVPLLRSNQVEIRGTRFFVVIAEPGWEPNGELVTAVEDAAAALGAAGATRLSWPAEWLAAALDITRRYWMRKTNELSGAEVDRQLEDWDGFCSDYLEASQDIDFLLTPASTSTAPLDREIVGDDFIYTLPASLTGSPAVVIPTGSDGAGMPPSVQLVGRPWEDHRVLAAARVIAASVGEQGSNRQSKG